mmetsp:Transcript_6964/g.10578  ORF Transcript_6964/g.10578 Transcript_6964/m.10578 type:complete len:80 (-) Transcript_6964:284-523(-)
MMTEKRFDSEVHTRLHLLGIAEPANKTAKSLYFIPVADNNTKSWEVCLSLGFKNHYNTKAQSDVIYTERKISLFHFIGI